MAKAVFIQSSHSHWADEPGTRYHFPRRNYGSVVERTIGDWVVFYEGRRGGRLSDYATQRVTGVEPDPADPARAYAILDPGSLLDFERPVPRERPDGTLFESTLPRFGGKNTSAVRVISDEDFAAIIEHGLAPTLGPNALPRREADQVAEPLTKADLDRVIWEGEDPLEERLRVLTSRAFRDQSFARRVKEVYGARCAISGLELRNGNGRPEVEAAHIRPVAERGPDTVRNGIALSGTIHWMFDRGLISIASDHSILMAPEARRAERLIHPERRLFVPEDEELRPHPAFLAWHRENCFKGGA